jgi:hypothetical protein
MKNSTVVRLVAVLAFAVCLPSFGQKRLNAEERKAVNGK